MRYQGITLQELFQVDKIFSIHYFEYMNDFSFDGESHDFWEFVFVDKGEVSISGDGISTILKKGDIAFHKPNEFHCVNATGGVPPNLVVLSFQCTHSNMDFFSERTLRVDESERNLLAEMIIESRNFLSSPLDDPYLTSLTRRNEPSVFGAEHLLKIHLEHFLIHLYRRYASVLSIQKSSDTHLPKTTKSRSDSELFSRVLTYFERNIHTKITIQEICQQNLIGRSQLQKIFQEKSNLGIIEYFYTMKIDAAKKMIRTKQMNFTQISEALGYSSIHYFSRQFKKTTNMTPSEYASSIKAMAEGRFKD